MLNLPTFNDVQAAASRLKGHALRTPVLTSRTMDAQLGASLFFKCENFQRMGAFKFRGGFNALSRFTPEQRKAGVCTFSSGNHAQAIALSARILGIPAAILMPQDAPQAKIDATRGYLAGTAGEVILFDRYTQDREALAAALARERGMTAIPPYDHPDVMAGQGTAALELLEETGYRFSSFQYLGSTAANPGVLNNVTHMFIALGGKKVGEQQLDHNESIDVLLKPLEEVRNLLRHSEIKQSMHALCLFYGFEYLQAHPLD